MTTDHKTTPTCRKQSNFHTTRDIHWTTKRWQYICDHNSGKSWWIL